MRSVRAACEMLYPLNPHHLRIIGIAVPLSVFI